MKNVHALINNDNEKQVNLAQPMILTGISDLRVGV